MWIGFWNIDFDWTKNKKKNKIIKKINVQILLLLIKGNFIISYNLCAGSRRSILLGLFEGKYKF